MVLTLALVVSTALTVAPPPPDAEAFQGDPGVPLTWAGSGAAGAAVGTLVMAPATVGGLSAGTAIVAFPGATVAAGLASFGAGFAIGYYGMKAACYATGSGTDPVTSIETQGIDSQICGASYEFQSDQPEGVEITPYTTTCPGLSGRTCATVSWDVLTDYGQGTGTPVLELVDGKGDPVRMNNRFTGCATNEQVSTGSSLTITVTNTSTGCPGAAGANGMANNTPAPYGPGSARAITSSAWPSFTSGWENGPFEPGDRWKVRLLKSGTIDRTRVLAELPASPEVNERGRQIRSRITAECWVGPSWTVSVVDNTGPYVFENNPGNDLNLSNPCPPGSIVKTFEIFRQHRNRDNVLQTRRVYKWDAPPEWDPTVVTEFDTKHQDCIKRGSGCKLAIETDTEDPDVGECKWGSNVVPIAYCSEPAPQVIEDPFTPTTPTTTAPPTTTVAPTTVPPQQCPDAPGCPSDTPPPGGEDPPEGGECFPSGWGWLNPVEWVLKPVKCALVWAFWDDDAADEIGSLWGDSAGPWVDTAVESGEGVEFTASVGECFTIPTSTAELCSSDVLDAPVPGSVATVFVAVWVFALLFELLGLFARITGG